MSKEYIDREAALKKVIEVKHFDTELGGVVLHRYIKESDLKNIPAADAVDVVLCCECKHWLDAEGIEERDGVRFARCDVHNFCRIDGNHYGWCPTEYDFCSCGEMKEGANNA